MSDMSFEQLLAQHNQEYKDSKEFSDWMPDDGKYTVVITKVDRGIKDEMLWWKHAAEILAGEGGEALVGREFTSGFFSSNNYGMAKGAAKVLNGGEKAPDTSTELDAVFMGATGAVLEVEIKTSVSKKNGREYTNCYYRELVATTDDGGQAQQESAEPPQGEPAPVGSPTQSDLDDL